MKLKKQVAIIPARGGSQRIPRKNIRDFCGKPIIAYSIEAALKSHLFGDVIVSTDDEEIKDIAISFGASVPFLRSEKNSNEFATTVDVLLEVIDKLDPLYEEFCCIYPTSPLLSSFTLIDSYKTYISEKLDFMMALTGYSFPIQRALKFSNQKVNFFNPEFSNVRSQDLEKSYHDAGQFYWGKTSVLLKHKTFYTENLGGYLLPEMKVQDIDNLSDWEIAEFKFRYLKEKSIL